MGYNKKTGSAVMDCRFNLRVLTRLAFGGMVLAISLGATTGFAQKFTVTVLGNIANGVSTSANAMNNAGQVVGSADDMSGNTFATIWNGTTPTIIAGHVLPGVSAASAYASAINNSGIVVGAEYSLGILSGYMPFVWGATFSNCPFCDAGRASGINDSGQFVGSVPVPGGGGPNIPAYVPVIWASPGDGTQPDALQLLNLNGGGAVGINDTGQIVGYSYTTNTACCGPGSPHATRWASSNSPPMDLGTLGGASSQALNINNRGFIVGWAEIGNGTEHAALWGPTTTAFDLGTLGGKSSYASGINVEGDVVGSAQTVWGVWHAVLWTNKHHKAVDLNYEIDGQIALEITLLDAVATNDRCMVVANGYNNKTGAAESFVLSLTDQSNCDEQ
jgi:probable HAF family extracellular repeat protein